MIRITRQTDYGIMLLAYLASRPPERILTARDAARECRLPVPMVSKILKALAREGILRSHRGVKGGYGLARSPDEVTVGSVIGALEGPIGMTACSSEPGSCEQEPLCPVRIHWQKITHAVRGALERIPLSEMIAPPCPSPPRAPSNPVRSLVPGPGEAGRAVPGAAEGKP